MDAGYLDLVNVDTTVQPQAITFLTDTRLYYNMIRTLGRLIVKAWLKVRLNHIDTSKRLLIMQNRYAHAGKYKHFKMWQKNLKKKTGRLTRIINRKLDFCKSEVIREQMVQLLDRLFGWETRQGKAERNRTASIKFMWNASPKEKPTSVMNLGAR